MVPHFFVTWQAAEKLAFRSLKGRGFQPRRQLKNSVSCRFREGHDFSRAVKLF
jgi:hypothetical protein